MVHLQKITSSPEDAAEWLHVRTEETPLKTVTELGILKPDVNERGFLVSLRVKSRFHNCDTQITLDIEKHGYY